MVTRRDFLNGIALTPAFAPGLAAAAMEGQTDALMAPAHRALRDRDAAAATATADATLDEGIEDLVVVGSGLSGLAGAWLWRERAGAGRRVLILDALDEPGGHARRNEFVARSGQRLVGYGGSQSLDSPSLFSPAVKHVLAGVGIELKRFERAFDSGWAARHGVEGTAMLFPGGQVVLRGGDEPATRWLPRTPLSAAAQAAWLALQRQHDPWPGLPRAARRDRLAATLYRDYLREARGLAGPGGDEVLALLRWSTAGYFGVGIDAVSALDAWAAGQPGFAGQRLGRAPDPRCSPSGRLLATSTDDYIHHFPDGNHGVARALLRALIPPSVPGEGMQTLPGSRLVHAMLDRPGAPVRVRQRASVIGLRHEGEPAQAEAVRLRYVDAEGRLREVRARQVLLACWHRVIARIAAAELPAAQRAALDDQVKVPLLYATVLVSDWKPWQAAGVSAIEAVGGFWQDVGLDFPVSLGDVRFPQRSDAPMLVHLGKVVVPGDGRPAREQAAAGRAQLLQWDFAFLEREIRQLLQAALGGHGFEAARDIEAITVNRWAHGYAYEYMRPWDAFWPQGPLPCETARRGWGHVAIANADAGAYAYAHSAIDQAARAVAELLPRARVPAWSRFPGP